MPYRHVPVAVATAELFKAIAHPMRVLILEELVQGDRTVGQLAERLEVEMSHLSQQLAVLRRAQVVECRRTGSSVRYSLRDPRTSQLMVIAKQLLVTGLTSSGELLTELLDGETAAAGRTGTTV